MINQVVTNEAKIRREKFLNEVQNVFCKVHAFPKLIEEIMYLYDKLRIKKNIEGKKLIYLIIVLYYQACRKKRIEKTLYQVIKLFEKHYRDITEIEIMEFNFTFFWECMA